MLLVCNGYFYGKEDSTCVDITCPIHGSSVWDWANPSRTNPEPIPAIPEAPKSRFGWICPVCARAVSPDEKTCNHGNS